MPSLAEQIRTSVKALLKTQQVTQCQLADRIGITPKHLSQMMRGHVGIRPELADQMFAALGRRPVLRLAVHRRNTP